MGAIHEVYCTRCGYRSKELAGVGGDIGYVGHPVWTVSCDRKHQLVDVWAPEDEASKERYWYKIDAPAPEIPCPNCGEVHEAWDPKIAKCPKCGAPGCKVVFTALWD